MICAPMLTSARERMPANVRPDIPAPQMAIRGEVFASIEVAAQAAEGGNYKITQRPRPPCAWRGPRCLISGAFCVGFGASALRQLYWPRYLGGLHQATCGRS